MSFKNINKFVREDESCQDALQYMAGWFAKKFNVKYPELGKYTYQTKSNKHDYKMPPWSVDLYHGGEKCIENYFGEATEWLNFWSQFEASV